MEFCLELCRDWHCAFNGFFTCRIAQRQVGETALNDNSSRSHQIIRLVSFMASNSIFFFIKLNIVIASSWQRFFFLGITNTDNTKHSP